jgi:putative addiction module component (TIGR02574 family)
MNKIDEAWAALRKLPLDQQERLANSILDMVAAGDHGLEISDAQAAELGRRLADPDPKYLSMSEVRARMRKFLA